MVGLALVLCCAVLYHRMKSLQAGGIGLCSDFENVVL